ncbi:hypothetical protein KDU71_00125 [Carboxylicivirga sediminis]|uniref:Type IX secretion system membrane protein PorP/SprF n=1 Tax=Carboxylicivirga sediminis TaxID=2006564 RepID=A0A941F186_9BACT|nr:hypothetical protein [Carboxylicivirga sediminis]MBR8533950.1 hypothetical protein [Carboxylicivirga sediminis]
MRHRVTFFFLLMGISLLHAQNEAIIQNNGLQQDAGLELPVDSFQVKPFSVNAGLSAFTNFEGMYGFNTFVAPQWALMPAKKFQVDVMPFVSRTNYYNIPAWGYADATKLKLDETMLQFGLYAQGTYLINEKWYAGASVFLDTTLPENANSQLQGFNNYGASTYVGYKFSDNFSAEVSFGVSKHPTFYSPSPGFMPMMHPRNPYNRFSR